MNSVALVGRIVRDIDMRYTAGENATAVARFSIAVDRRMRRDGETNADFPSCIAFGKTAEFVNKYFKKGQRIGLTGRIQTGSYTNKDGNRVYTTDVIADAVEFVESKGASDGTASAGNTVQKPKDTDFMTVPDGAVDELPFN